MWKLCNAQSWSTKCWCFWLISATCSTDTGIQFLIWHQFFTSLMPTSLVLQTIWDGFLSWMSPFSGKLHLISSRWKYEICMFLSITTSTTMSLFLIAIIPLSTNPTSWSNILKQFVSNLPTNCLSVFDHFVGLVPRGFSSYIHAATTCSSILNDSFQLY